MQIIPYLNFAGDCAEALTFYAEILGGKVDAIIPYEGTPAAEYVCDDWKSKVVHGQISVGNWVIMGSDAGPEHFKRAQGTSINLNCDSAEQADSLFAALSDGAIIAMPIAETFWAKRFGMLMDRFGTPWMINFSGMC